jgi:hypothetical protein
MILAQTNPNKHPNPKTKEYKMLPNIRISMDDTYSPIPLSSSALQGIATKIRNEYGRAIQNEMKHYLRIADHITSAFEQSSVSSYTTIIKEPSLDAIVSIAIDSKFRMSCALLITRNSIELEAIQITEGGDLRSPCINIILEGCIVNDYLATDIISYYHNCFLRVDDPSELADVIANVIPKEVQQEIFCQSELFSTNEIKYIEPTISEFKHSINEMFANAYL